MCGCCYLSSKGRTERFAQFRRCLLTRYRGHSLRKSIRLIASAVVLGVAATLVVASSSVQPASASVGLFDIGDLSESSRFALNIPGELLTAAADDVGLLSSENVAASLANGSQFEWQWVTVPAYTAFSGTVTSLPPIVGPAAPGLTAPELAALQELELQFAAPASKLSPLLKPVAGPLVAVPVGLALGRGINGLFGLDTQKELCAGGEPGWDAAGEYLTSLSFGDCHQWVLDANLELNADQPLEDIGSGSCYLGVCAYYLGSVVATGFTYATLKQYCFEMPGYGSAWIGDITGWARNQLDLHFSSNNNEGLRPDYNGACAEVYGPIIGYTVNGIPIHGDTGPHNRPFSASYTYETSDSLLSWSLIPTMANWSPLAAVAPTPVTQAQANPSRTFRCTVTFEGGGVVSQTSDSFTEQDQTVPAPSCPAFGPGQIPSSTSIYEVSDDGSLLLATFPTSSEYRSWLTQYPECANGSCLLDLRHSGFSCFLSTTDCDGWVVDPQRSQNYGCWYGTHLMSISSCFVYGSAFNPESASIGTAYSDPATGLITGGQTSISDEDLIVQSLMSRSEVVGWGYEPAPTLQALREWARAVAAQCVSLSALPGMGSLSSDCRTMPIFSPGSDVQAAAEHDFEAIMGNPLWTYLDYLNSAETDLTMREWYLTDPRCGPYPSGTEACDEYPYWVSEQGGPGASLKMIVGLDNSNEGIRLNGFATVCLIKSAPIHSPERKFLVIPLPGNFAPPTTAWCAG